MSTPMTNTLFVALTLAGVCAITVAATLLYAPLGLFVGGFIALIIARKIAEDPDAR